jgi:ParB family chromosome partitioning protein
MGEASPGVVSPYNAIHVLPISQLEPGAFQPRTHFDEQAMAELADSIRQHGVLQPLLVRPLHAARTPAEKERFQIVAGERRWRAAQAAGLHEVPVLVRMIDSHFLLAAALVENLQRQDLDAIEEAEGFHRLQEEFGLTQEQLSATAGKSRSYIANSTRLLGLPASVRADVQKGHLSAGHARALLGHPDPEAAARLVIARGLNVRQTEALASKKTPVEKREVVEKDSETASLEASLSERLGLRTRISFDGKGGVVSIDYKTLDQLDGLLALLHR